MKEKVKVRLKRDHYLNGRKKRAGTIVRLSRETAKWLVDLGRALWAGKRE